MTITDFMMIDKMVIVNSNSIALKGKTALALRIEPLDNLRHIKNKVK
jgi:hypothetical protein